MKLSAKFSILFLGLSALTHAQTLEVEVDQTRSRDVAFSKVNQAVNLLNGNLAKIIRAERQTKAARLGQANNLPALYPTTVWLTQNGQRLPFSGAGKASRMGTGLNLVFDTSGPGAFDPAFRTYLQSVYTKAQPFLDALFGTPAVGGNVAVKNADGVTPPIGNREDLMGGYYVPNAPGTPEIHFVPYVLEGREEVAAINFIHCLLLAYIGPNQYGYDAFNEGLVRAVTMRIARTPAAMITGLDSELIENVLLNTYDVEGYYDWYNQRSLGGAKFIAPNLRYEPLPDAGSVGGLFQIRHKMAAGAWTKVLAEYPNFAATFNAGFYAQPGIASNAPALVALGQTTLNTLRSGDPTIEGQSFAEWFKRQYALETKTTLGLKLHVQPTPILGNLSGNDFGPFIVETHWFETKAGGNESLLSGRSFPIFWEGNLTLNRLFPGQLGDEQIPIALGYGSIVPNLRNEFGGAIYRSAIDVPVQDQIERVYVPVGAIATPSQPNPRDLFGTVVGANLQAGDTLRLQVTVNGNAISDIPVTRNAFGVLLNTSDYLNNARLVVRVVRNRLGNDTTLLTRRVNKGPGPLALDLRVDGDGTFTPSGGLPKGISLLGFPINPFASLNSEVLNVADNQLLAARYNSSKARYELYPELESFKVGHGYFVRLDAAQPSFSVSGRQNRNIESTVALKPGWNIVSAPIAEAVTKGRIRVTRTTGFPTTWNEAAGVDVGLDFFQFTPGPNDAGSGAPETGSFSPATQFEVGKAYFVQVLAPEGVTLSFQPAGSTGNSQAPVSAPPSTGWRLGIEMKLGNQSAKAIIGQSATATKSFDPKEDSGMPPGFGNGFQVIVEDLEQMYQDVRALRAGEVFTIRLQGMTPNKLYKIDFAKLLGNLPNLTLRDPKGSNWIIRPGFGHNYVPKSSVEYIKITVGASN